MRQCQRHDATSQLDIASNQCSTGVTGITGITGISRVASQSASVADIRASVTSNRESTRPVATMKG